MKSDVKIGLALSGGAMRGLAHIGVLEVLDENEIPIDIIAGTSMGSFVGAVYSAGMKPSFMRAFAESITLSDERKYIDISVPKLGMIKGVKIEKLIYTLTGGKSIEQLDIPYVAVASCIEDNDVKYFDRGDLTLAIRSSIAVPGIFEPVTIDGKTYVDGGVLERVPVTILKKMGADYIISVDVNPRGGLNKTPKSMFDLMLTVYSMMEWQAMEKHTTDEDISINPKVRHINPANFRQAKECIDLGHKAALECIDEIKLQLSMMGISTKR